MMNRPVAEIIATENPAPEKASALWTAFEKSLKALCIWPLPSLTRRRIVGLNE